MQKFPVALLWFLASLTMVTGAGAAQWSSLKGSYAVTPKNYLDPSDEEPKDTHFRIQLTGQIATAPRIAPDAGGASRRSCRSNFSRRLS